jgi:hypothetical protein
MGGMEGRECVTKGAGVHVRWAVETHLSLSLTLASVRTGGAGRDQIKQKRRPDTRWRACLVFVAQRLQGACVRLRGFGRGRTSVARPARLARAGATKGRTKNKVTAAFMRGACPAYGWDTRACCVLPPCFGWCVCV